ncbi:MAG: twin-arginine translocation signal domain-containing protein, partial [candidate division Zixibacteria bacterium]|nr:twin-arginine translocation signal domain-containing protein [candidate division Zixibacteria bacterium]
MIRKEKISFTRRDFLKGTTFTTLGVALGLVSDEVLSYQEGKKERVVLIRDKNVLNEELKVDSK